MSATRKLLLPLALALAIAACSKPADTAAPAAPADTTAAAPAEAAAPEAPAEPAPAQEPATLEDTSEEKPVYDPEAPNPNPVEAGPAVAPKDENGKFDATKIADASDFGDWEEQGCKG